MQKKKIGLRFVSALLSAVVLAAGVYNEDVWKETPVSAMTLEELQAQKEANASKISQKQKELSDIGADQINEKAYQEKLSEKLDLQEENLKIVDEQLTRIEESIYEKVQEISDTQTEIVNMEADIAVDLEEFKTRVRAMYVSGNDSLASALVGATDFFDFLSKFDILSRIAKHDNDLVNNLKSQVIARNDKKTELEHEKADLDVKLAEQKESREEFAAAILQLQEDYKDSEEQSKRLAEQAALLNADITDLEAINAELDAEDKRIQQAILEAQEAERLRAEQEAAALAAQQAAAQQQQQQQHQYGQNISNGYGTTPSYGNGGAGNATPAVTTQAPYAPQATTHVTTTRAQATTQQPVYTTPAPVYTTPEPVIVTTTTAAPVVTDPPVVTTEEPIYQSSRFAWPCPGFYVLTSGFGPRWGTHHSGIDISSGGIRGAAIVASRGGTVITVNNSCPHDYGKSGSCGCGGGYGNYVIIQHDGTYSTVYGHMSSACVSYGQTVSQGQVIGYVGSTGYSTGDHLHFEVRVNGTRVDPEQYLY